jgi:hypothetical protein
VVCRIEGAPSGQGVRGSSMSVTLTSGAIKSRGPGGGAGHFCKCLIEIFACDIAKLWGRASRRSK